MNVRTHSRRSWVAGTGTALLLAALLSVTSAPAAYADGVVVPGNNSCADLVSGAREFKIEDPASGNYTDGTLTVALTVHPLAADVPDHPGNQTGNEVFDFAATGAVVVAVAVKGGPNTNFYDYRPAGTAADDLLHAPLNPANNKFPDLSHISFCYVPKAKPKISTTVSNPEITIGGSVTDTAQLTAGNTPTGTITFRVYGPDDATCSGTPAAGYSVAVNGNGAYPSPAFTPGAVGTYRWIATYSGDWRNEAVSGACNDPGEQAVVKKAKPRLTTVPDVLPNDTATIAGLVGPAGGTVTFALYGNATCTGSPIYVQPAQPVNANGSYHTTNTTVRVSSDTTIGWIVQYSGDARNEAAASACSDEQVKLDFTPIATP
ncbi:hypothetical protein AB0J80_31425 [Actinoplanes sp. NPDC049548]|uniref:hypothetical protein n=1 Tax=Actinoplanes sp. NPDC049548 TaxID=3155152 RepID=UPI00342B676E